MRLFKFKRFFALAVLACFIVLMGVEFFHSHHGEHSDQCQLCSMTAQAVAHVAQAAPQIVSAPVRLCKLVIKAPAKAAAHSLGSQSRAPPLS